jgi:integrase
MCEKDVWQMLKTMLRAPGCRTFAPPDLRQTTAKLCRTVGRGIGADSLLLGHSSVQRTERLLGRGQDLAPTPNDATKLKLALRERALFRMGDMRRRVAAK